METSNIETYLARTFELAKQGIPWARPNPLVGAVLVKNWRVIGEGYHHSYGGPHAEIRCLENATEDPRGATLFCNLEPCCHTDKQTPPCTEAILRSHIAEVVVATLDPNPKVRGQGLEQLRRGGIKVSHGFMELKARELNEVYFTFVEQGRPFVIAKWAQGLDGTLATHNLHSQWISGESSRKIAHQLRLGVEAVAVGERTAIIDDPALTVRFGLSPEGYVPYRILIGDADRIPSGHQLFSDQFKHKTLAFPWSEGPKKILQELAQRKISSLLVEGGARTIRTFLREQLVDKIHIFLAPKFLGEGPKVSEGLQLPTVDEAITLGEMRFENCGQDIHLWGYPNYKQIKTPSWQ